MPQFIRPAMAINRMKIPSPHHGSRSRSAPTVKNAANEVENQRTRNTYDVSHASGSLG